MWHLLRTIFVIFAINFDHTWHECDKMGCSNRTPKSGGTPYTWRFRVFGMFCSACIFTWPVICWVVLQFYNSCTVGVDVKWSHGCQQFRCFSSQQIVMYATISYIKHLTRVWPIRSVLTLAVSGGRTQCQKSKQAKWHLTIQLNYWN